MDSDAIAFLNLIATVLIATVAAAYTILQKRRSTRLEVAAIHRDLTTGEVAEARNITGTHFYSHSVPDGELIHAYYQLCWAIERANNNLKAINAALLDSDESKDEFLRSGWRKLRRRFVNDASEWLGCSVDEILRNIGRVHDEEGKRLNLSDRHVQEWLTERLDGGLRRRYEHVRREEEARRVTEAEQASREVAGGAAM